MQERSSGELYPVSKEAFEAERAIANPAKRRPTFAVGEVVQVNGGWFKIRKVTRKDLILRGVPAPAGGEKR